MRTGVVDVSGQGMTLHVFDHDAGGARAVLYKSVALHLRRREPGMILAPGLMDLAAETARRFAIAAGEAGCSYIHVTLADELADAQELAERVGDAVGRRPPARGGSSSPSAKVPDRGPARTGR